MIHRRPASRFSEALFRNLTHQASVQRNSRLFAGPILVRGGRLDGSSGEKLRFSWNGSKPSETLELDAPPPWRTDPAHWSFWPTGMYVPRAGCYGLQIDTKAGTDVVVFEGVRAKRLEQRAESKVQRAKGRDRKTQKTKALA